MTKLLEIGWEEWIALPELKLPAIRAKVDTGAKTSALHAFMVEKVLENGDLKVRFGIHPIPQRPEIEVYCKAHLVDEREIISSNGQAELRYVIRTLAQFGKKKWPIEITLTDRETMAYRMLIGRSAMEGKLLVVPEKSFMLGALSPSVYDNIAPRRHKKTLKICILSSSRQSYTKDRIISVAEARGHHIEVINATRCYVDISSNKPTIHYQGKILHRFDTIIPRIGPSVMFYGVAILRQFEALGMFCLNSSAAITHSRDRLFSHQLLGRAGISMPITAFAHYPGDTKDMIKIVGGAPLVIKLLDGPQGKGVVLAETNKAAETVIQAFRGLKANFIAQAYIKESVKKDIHCIILGNKVLSAIEKIHHENDLSSHNTNHGKTVKLTVVEKKLAVRAARVLGLKFAAVNLLRTKEGPRVIDVNSSPGLNTFESVTGDDIACSVIEYIEAHARPRLPKRIIGFHV
ncbi:MAG: 30S ribosomal protein S6--L-glutamate ligase [Proteobacteria bacterium]|nr:30S ribosomal protein S6--L-glutamate ligase [Pseudomonadota bacterium]